MQSQINVFVPLLTVAVLLGFAGGFAAKSPLASKGPCIAIGVPSDRLAYAMVSQSPDNSQDRTASWSRWAAVTDF